MVARDPLGAFLLVTPDTSLLAAVATSLSASRFE
jgi:hypothetical protein